MTNAIVATCNNCSHWDTSPFWFQCDGVTPTVNSRCWGLCMQFHHGNPPAAACKDWSRLFVSVCMQCQHVIGPDNRPLPFTAPEGALKSHGVCLACAPAYCSSLGLSAAETARILAAATTGRASVPASPDFPPTLHP